ncbi:MFS transporter [Periweissella cryptocerci]|nr:MFS transporter [Periweissella cryptocerci]
MNKNKITAKLAILSISLLLTSVNAMNGTLPLMKESMHLTVAQGESLLTVSSLSVVIMVLASTTIAKLLGTKRTIVLGLILTGIAGSLPIFLNTYVPFMLSRIALGAGLGLFNSIAVAIIQEMYAGNTRASMLGFRNAAEPLGQAMMTVVAGLLMAISWHLSYAVYLIAFPILIFFLLSSPDLDHAGEPTVTEVMQGATVDTTPYPQKMSPLIWLFAIFSLLLIGNVVSLNIRFPQLAAQIMGENFNASNLLAIMPLFGIVFGVLFGWLNRKLGKMTFYLGLGLLILSNFMMAFSGHNFIVLVLAYFINGVPPSLVIPYMFNALPRLAPKKSQAFASSMMIVGLNGGSFVTPFLLKGIGILEGTTALAAPFEVLGALMALIAFGTLIYDLVNKQYKKITVER